MEAAVKHLREGLVRDELGSAFVCVHDGLDVVGGRDVFIQVRGCIGMHACCSVAMAACAVDAEMHACMRTATLQLAQAFVAAVASGRAQAQRVVLLALEKSPHTYLPQPSQQQQQQPQVTVLDAHASTQGWGDDRCATMSGCSRCMAPEGQRLVNGSAASAVRCTDVPTALTMQWPCAMCRSTTGDAASTGALHRAQNAQRSTHFCLGTT